MSFQLLFSSNAAADFTHLKSQPNRRKQFKAVRKALAFLELNPRHPGLQTHEYTSLTKEFGVKVFEAYAEQNTPEAYRIFWHYGPEKGQITIIGIKPHPK